MTLRSFGHLCVMALMRLLISLDCAFHSYDTRVQDKSGVEFNKTFVNSCGIVESTLFFSICAVVLNLIDLYSATTYVTGRRGF